jgi:excisionase family DNA binding protein
MNKKEASARLNVSVRLVEKYASEGRLGPVSYVRGRTGKQADFDEAEVERLKAELESVDHALVVAPNRRATGLAGRGTTEEFVSLLASAIQQASEHNHVPPAISELAHKLMLSLPEAARLSGVPVQTLRGAVKTGKLKIVKSAGRGFGKVKRDSLEAYVKKL